MMSPQTPLRKKSVILELKCENGLISCEVDEFDFLFDGQFSGFERGVRGGMLL